MITSNSVGQVDVPHYGATQKSGPEAEGNHSGRVVVSQFSSSSINSTPHQPVRRLHGSRRILPLMFLRMNAAKARTSLMILIRNSRLLMHADFAANLWKPVAFLPVGWLSRRLADKSMDSSMANSAGCFPFPTGIAQNPSGRVSHLSIHPVRWVRHKPCSG